MLVRRSSWSLRFLEGLTAQAIPARYGFTG